MLMKGNPRVKKGCWRTHKEPMQVVSGALSGYKVHFEAPPSKDVPKEMERFICWFNNTGPGGKQEIKPASVRSAVVHLYFETIHPFEDGNGRIGRILSEKALSQGLGRPVLLSLSKTIDAGKKNYYEALKAAQKSNEVTGWIQYFIGVVLSAQSEAEQLVEFILQKTRFFDRYREKLNARHTKVINRMLSEGPKGFKGGMSAKKYVSLTGVSKATATRDLQYLMEIGVFKRIGGGRSIRYDVDLD
jgi:Fic family protein